MTHPLPHHIAAILETWDNLGFTCKREAAEFIVANENWNELVKDTDLDKKDTQVVNEWRINAIDVDKSKIKML